METEGGLADEPEVLHIDPNRTDVYLNDSFEAADAIAAARRLAGRGRWTEAAELLQGTSDSLGDKLVRVSPGRYVGIREHIADLIADWPKPGINAYRSLYEREIQRKLETETAERAVESLLPLFDRYFCTRSAAELADVIGQLAIESGDLALAECVYRRVLERHPDRVSHAPRLRAMLTLIAAIRDREGLDPGAVTEDVTLRWMGEPRTLRDIVGDIGDSFRATDIEPSPFDWPIFGGDADRNRPSSSRVDEMGLLWRFRVLEPPTGDADDSDLDESSFYADAYPHRLSVQPVVGNGLIIIQWFREIMALHRTTGVEEWRFSADTGSPSDFDDFEEQPQGFDSVTIHAGQVYAALPGNVLPYYTYDSGRSTTELVCLDLKTGRVVWRADQDDLGVQFTELYFDPSPFVAHGRLYLVGRRRRSFGFEDCYLYRFSAADGRFEKRTHLGSASTGTFGSRQATMTIPAMGADTLYVCTNLGSVAAVSAHTGAVRWLRLYERDLGEASHGSSWSLSEIPPWRFNPIIRSDGKIVCLPTDSNKLLVFSEREGELLQAVPTNELSGMQTVLGVHGDLLCGTGQEVICYDLAAETVRWSSPLPRSEALSGRGVWAEDRLLVPMLGGLATFRVSDGRSTDAAWDPDGGGGNLLALPDQLIVAGAADVATYVRKAEIWTALRERMAAAPSDPLPALELAEVAFGSGEVTEALAALDEAVRRAGGLPETIEPTLKGRIFKDVLTFAETLSARSALEPAVLDRLFALASQYPPERTAYVRYRLKFGRLFEELGRPEQSLQLYQLILRDRSLRELSADPSDTGSKAAGEEARTRIAGLINEHGLSIYAPYEVEAARWLEGAKAVRDEAALRRVAETFPNSKAAPLALTIHGELLSESGRAREAARRFSEAYHRYPEQVDRPTLLRKIADAYERAGKLEHAYRWLTKAAHEYPSVFIKHNGRSVTFSEYRERLADVRGKVVPSRPNLTLPLDHAFSQDFGEGCSLLVPWFGDDPLCDWSRYWVYTPAGIRAFDARTNVETWTKPAPSRIRAELLVATSEVAVFATLYEVFAVDVVTGARRWSHGEYPAHLKDDGADWEEGQAFRTHTLQDGRLLSVRDNGLITCVAVDDGRPIWSQTHRPVPAGRVQLADLWTVYHVTSDGQAVLCVLDSATGAWVTAIETVESRPVEGLFVSLDGQVVLVTSQSISSYDVETSRRRWRVELDDHLRQASLLLDIDAVYLSDDGRRLKKICLEDGRMLWESDRLISRGEAGLTVQLQDGSVIVSTTSSVSAVDNVTGLTLWRGATPQRPRFVQRFIITGYYVLAVDVPDEMREAQSVAYFYDHRNASGVIPRDGGALKLGQLADIRAILATDGTLLIQTGSTIQGWTPR